MGQPLVLVTGGCGFIGSHLVDALLEQGAHVRVLDNLSTGKKENIPLKKIELIEGDIIDSQTVHEAMKDVTAVVHLAAVASVQQSQQQWAVSHQVNLTGMIHLLEAARENRTPIIYASSAAVYGNSDLLPLKEESPAMPLTPYGADKLGCELHARAGWACFGVPTVGLRFFNVYGPRQDPSSPYSGVISIFADRLKQGKPLVIYGDGEQTRDFIWVGDVVRALLAALENCREGHAVYNVATGRSVSVRELAEALEEVMGVSVPKEYVAAREGDIRHSLGDASRLREALGVAPTASFHEHMRCWLG